MVQVVLTGRSTGSGFDRDWFRSVFRAPLCSIFMILYIFKFFCHILPILYLSASWVWWVWLLTWMTIHHPSVLWRFSAEPFSHGTGTLRCLQKEMATNRHWSVSLWRDPDDVSHCRILSPDKTEWRLISATLCGWGRCFVADQLW